MTPHDLKAFDDAESSARALLNMLLELKRAFKDGEAVAIGIDRAALQHRALGQKIHDLPRHHDTGGHVAGRINPSPTRVGGGDATGPDDGSAA